MNKINLKMVPSVNTTDIVKFIVENSDLRWNSACTVLSTEMDRLLYDYPDQMHMIDEYRISKVIVKELKLDGWIKKFTETQELKEDYYVLFTD